MEVVEATAPVETQRERTANKIYFRSLLVEDVVIDIKFTGLPLVGGIERDVRFEEFDRTEKLWEWSKCVDKYLAHIYNIYTLWGNQREEPHALVIGQVTPPTSPSGDSRLIITFPQEDWFENVDYDGHDAFMNDDHDAKEMVQYQVMKIASELLLLKWEEMWQRYVSDNDEKDQGPPVVGDSPFQFAQAPTSNLLEPRVEFYITCEGPINVLRHYITHSHRSNDWPSGIQWLTKARSISFQRT